MEVVNQPLCAPVMEAPKREHKSLPITYAARKSRAARVFALGDREGGGQYHDVGVHRVHAVVIERAAEYAVHKRRGSRRELAAVAPHRTVAAPAFVREQCVRFNRARRGRAGPCDGKRVEHQALRGGNRGVRQRRIIAGDDVLGDALRDGLRGWRSLQACCGICHVRTPDQDVTCVAAAAPAILPNTAPDMSPLPPG